MEAERRGGRGAAIEGLGGDCYDNALCESFLATLECEPLDRLADSLRSPAARSSVTSSLGTTGIAVTGPQLRIADELRTRAHVPPQVLLMRDRFARRRALPSPPPTWSSRTKPGRPTGASCSPPGRGTPTLTAPFAPTGRRNPTVSRG